MKKLIIILIISSCGTLNISKTFFNKSKYDCLCDSDKSEVSFSVTKELVNGRVRHDFVSSSGDSLTFYLKNGNGQYFLFEDSINENSFPLINFSKVEDTSLVFLFGSVFGGKSQKHIDNKCVRYKFKGITTSSKFISEILFNAKNNMIWFKFYDGKSLYKCD